jgi:parallel beta-helix repeat protein
MKEKTKAKLLMYVFWVFVSVAIVAWPIAAKEIKVPQDFPTIQAAVDAADEGDTITVAPGLYQENVVIAKRLTLQGVGADQVTIAAADPSRPTLVVRLAQGVIVQGFTITGGYGGVRTESQAQAALTANRIVGNRWDGVEIRGPAQATLENNEISSNGDDGIDVWDYGQATITKNKIFGNWKGVSIWAFAQADLKENEISGNSIGALVWVGAQASFIGNKISGNHGHGLEIRDAAQVLIQTNEITENLDDGVLLAGEAKAELRDNKIINNGLWGIAAYQKPCHTTAEMFKGSATGGNNELSGNKQGDLCEVPEDLKKG